MKIDTEVTHGSTSTRAVNPDVVGKGVIVVVAFIASLCLLPWIRMSVFPDEGATLYSAHLSWSDLWAQSRHVDLVLLPYYVLIHFWLTISGSIVWVRAVSLCALFGTIVVIGWTGVRIAGKWCGILAAVLTATSTLLVEKSLNARPYELSTFLVAVSAVYLFRWLNAPRARWMWVFVVVALLATAMQLFSLLAPISMLLCALVVRPELLAQRLRRLLAPLVVLAIAAGAWIVVCIRQVGQVNWIANESITGRLTAEIRGPLIGQAYDFVLFVIAVAVVTKFALVWSSGGREIISHQVSRDRDILAVTIGWAVVPTAALSIVSFAHPIFSVRYISASAPGAALLAAFICVRAFPAILDPHRVSDQFGGRRWLSRTMACFGAAAVIILAVGYVNSASALQEDLQGPARYIAQHANRGDVVALPDHAITSGVEYYWANDRQRIALWPQLGVRQRYVEGFDLSLHPSGGLPHRVWLVSDFSVPGVTHFEMVLKREGYLLVNVKEFDGSTLFVYQSALPATSVLVPSDGATLSGTSATLAIANSNRHGVGIRKVQFVLSGGSYHKTVIGTAVLMSFGFFLPWNTTNVPNGSYTLQSLATDGAGFASYSQAIPIKVNNAGR